jgi:hypothetical protein
MGFDAKTLRTVIRIRKQDDHERQEQEALLATYMIALGMVPSEDADASPGEASSEATSGEAAA